MSETRCCVCNDPMPPHPDGNPEDLTCSVPCFYARERLLLADHAQGAHDGRPRRGCPVCTCSHCAAAAASEIR